MTYPFPSTSAPLVPQWGRGNGVPLDTVHTFCILSQPRDSGPPGNITTSHPVSHATILPHLSRVILLPKAEHPRPQSGINGHKLVINQRNVSWAKCEAPGCWCDTADAEEHRYGSFSPVEERLWGQWRGEGGWAASLFRFTHIQTLPPSAELMEQFHYCEWRKHPL